MVPLVSPQKFDRCRVQPLSKGLVVDDVRAVRQIVLTVMQNRGLSVLEANDGFDAWKFLQDELVDIVFTDIEMPKWNGIDLLRKMRQSSDERLRTLPVVVLSSLDRPKLVQYVSRFENAYFVRKPVSMRQLDIMLGLIETSRWLRLQRLRCDDD